jgi:hypothetical protein
MPTCQVEHGLHACFTINDISKVGHCCRCAVHSQACRNRQQCYVELPSEADHCAKTLKVPPDPRRMMIREHCSIVQPVLLAAPTTNTHCLWCFLFRLQYHEIKWACVPGERVMCSCWCVLSSHMLHASACHATCAHTLLKPDGQELHVVSLLAGVPSNGISNSPLDDDTSYEAPYGMRMLRWQPQITRCCDLTTQPCRELLASLQICG